MSGARFERTHFPIAIDRDLVEVSEIDRLTPSEAFRLAEQICAAAYQCQGGPAVSPEDRDEQRQTREQRKASAFEQLYCTIRDMADDFYRETLRRKAGAERGLWSEGCSTVDGAIDSAFSLVYRQTMDY